MDPSLIVKAHTLLAIFTIVIYFFRGTLMLSNSSKANSRNLLAIASIITLILFGLGVYLGFMQKLSFADGYILSKILGLLLFVGLGVIALKPGLSKPVAVTLWIFGLAVFAYIFAIAKQYLQPLF